METLAKKKTKSMSEKWAFTVFISSAGKEWVYSRNNWHHHHQFTASAYSLINLNFNEIHTMNGEDDFIQKLHWGKLHQPNSEPILLKSIEWRIHFTTITLRHSFPPSFFHCWVSQRCRRENKIVIFFVDAIAFSPPARSCSFSQSSKWRHKNVR